jgi:hypothetical protein
VLPAFIDVLLIVSPGLIELVFKPAVDIERALFGIGHAR